MNDQTTQPTNEPALPVNLDSLTPEQQKAMLDALWVKLYDAKTDVPERPTGEPIPNLDNLSYEQLETLAHNALDKWHVRGLERKAVQQPAEAHSEPRTFAETVDWVQSLDTEQILALETMIDRATIWQDEGLPQDEIMHRLGELADAIKNPPIDVGALTETQLSALHWAVVYRMSCIDAEEKRAKKAQVEALKAELKELTGHDYEQADKIKDARFLLDYDPKRADPTYDPAPWFTDFGTVPLFPYDKHFMQHAGVVVGHLIGAGLMPIVPAEGHNSGDAASDIAQAIKLVSRGMWFVYSNLWPDEFAYRDYNEARPAVADSSDLDESEVE